MKTIIAGSRGITEILWIVAAVVVAETVHGITITEVVSGRARGADQLGEQYAAAHNIPIKEFPADWNTHGKRAGYIRNVQMAEYADALIAIWDGHSRGTKHMIETAKEKGLNVYVHSLTREAYI